MKTFQFFVVFLMLKSSNSEELKCSFVNHFDGYNCDMITSYETGSEVTEVKGSHKFGKGISDVEVFFINGQSTSKYIPTKVCSFMKNIKKIDIYGKKIVEIKQEIFKECLKVKKVMIRHTNLKTLDSNLLSSLIRLETFALEFSNVEVLPENFFQYNKKLSQLHMPNNQLKVINAELPSNLTSLILTNNICIDMSYSSLRFRSFMTIDKIIEEVSKKCKNSSTVGEIETPEQLRIKSLEDKVIDYSEKFIFLETKIENDIDALDTQLRTLKISVMRSELNLTRLQNGNFERDVKDIKTKSADMKEKIKQFGIKSDQIEVKVKKSSELKVQSKNLKLNISRNKDLIITMLTIQSIIIVYILCVVLYGKFYLSKASQTNSRLKSSGRRADMTEQLIADDNFDN